MDVTAIGLDFPGKHTLSDRNSGVEFTKVDSEGALKQELKRQISAEGNFTDPQETEAVFEELDGIPNEFAYHLVQSLTAQENHPIGEPKTVEVKDESGNVQTIPNVADVGDASGGVGFFVILGIIIVVLFGIFVCIKIAS